MNLEKLLTQPESVRDEKWEMEVLSLLPYSQGKVVSETPKNGPDGWPYLSVQLGGSDSPESMSKILHWLSEAGVGMVINPHKYIPDYVLPYGMIWNFRLTGRFFSPEQSKFSGLQQVEFPEGEKVISGAPSLDYWPEYARKVFCEFLAQQGIMEPEALVISRDKINYDLCFSLECFGNPPVSEHKDILEALSWFFPGHYSLALMSRSGLPPFHPLKASWPANLC
ncbi:MAG: hypothetical protein IPJ71_10395 [Bdellovibrionales bacterium]|nr:hypothetical protein [Bdellovibrionales bacterium]